MTDLAGAVEKLPELRPWADPDGQARRGFRKKRRHPEDPHLEGIVAAWPSLSVEIRQAILALVEHAGREALGGIGACPSHPDSACPGACPNSFPWMSLVVTGWQNGGWR